MLELLSFSCISVPSLIPPANKCPDLSIRPANLIAGSTDRMFFENSSDFIIPNHKECKAIYMLCLQALIYRSNNSLSLPRAVS